ncbi:uncharacterized protein XM38_023400 [Halomicronema hongdechloris C2206]|uniref:DUF1995 domain-containing protein n=1 Tax=Halomicronema hongdechloris C2206 TaxID=1641165 RepID=A0A1Z3HM74_9CYAN|nr:DUF1995 family protein [Halomicronema hongdechloris]ASC71388.1 uncharacterized protein XM38_023400 [Halomicronema hongdechloris C2206]
MAGVPRSLEDAIAQAREATAAAISNGVPRILVEIVIPELKIMPVAQQFYPVFRQMGLSFKVLFPDAGAAALAKRDWDNPDFTIRGLGEVKGQGTSEEAVILVVEPSSVEVGTVEALCNEAAGSFVVLLNPKLEDVATIGIGYAGRQLRQRFLNTLESSYYLRSQQDVVLLRCYPEPWQVWQETAANQYELLAERPQKPSGEALDRLLSGADDAAAGEGSETTRARPRRRLLSELSSFIRALTQ